MQLRWKNITRATRRTRALQSNARMQAIERFWPRRLSRWRDIGILLSYACPAACASCYLNSNPQRRGLIPLDDLRNTLREMKKLGCSGRHLHFGGGEPFLDYEHLLNCLEITRQEGMLPIRKIETNAFWCTSDKITRQRLAEIKSFGINELLISCDPFHQQYIPLETVRRADRIAREVLGSDAVQIWQQRFLDMPVDISNLPSDKKAQAVRKALHGFPIRFIGRAAGQLTPFVKRHPKETFANEKCVRSLLWSRTIHIDPHGNVYPGQCAGVLIGNTRDRPLSHIYKHFKINAHPVVRTLAERGPVSLLQEAIQRGFEESARGYASKCHICYKARSFFWNHGLHRDEIGPMEVYAE